MAYHAWSCVMRLDVVHQIITCQSPDVFSRAQDGPSQGAVLEGCCMQMVKDNLLCYAFNLHAERLFRALADDQHL